MASKIKSKLDIIKENLLDREKYKKTVRTATYIILFVVGILMTILNIFTEGNPTSLGPRGSLTITTGVFSIVLLLCFLFSLIGPRTAKVSSVIFSIALIVMFTMFLIDGAPEGFSAIWICLLPIAGMLFFNRKRGSILCAIMFVIMVLLFWVKIYRYVPILDKIQHIEENSAGEPGRYTDTFLIRFPILYVSFYTVTFLLQTIQEFQFSVLEKVSDVNAKYSSHDQLTGLLNRKGFYELLENELKTKVYSKIGFIIFDLDFFKNLNDTYGHLAGDEVLIEFAQVIKDYLGNSLAACRWGGEEFLVCYLDDAINKTDLENFRKEIENHKFISDNRVMKTTVSGGVFETNDKNYSNRSIWLKNADTALYQAKETGRNKIIYF